MDNEVKMTKEELTSLLSTVSKTALDERIKELGLTDAVRKFIGGSMTEEEVSKLGKHEKSAKFLRAVFSKDIGTLRSMKAMNEGTGSAGGFIVPEEFAAEVNRIVEDFGLISKLATKYPMSYDTLNVPRLSASVSVTYPGETVAGTPSQPTLEQVVLAAKTCVGITPMSNELLADANVNVVQLLATLFAEAIAGTEDSQGLVGTGSPFTGILGDAGCTVVTSTVDDMDLITVDDARDLIAGIKPWALQGACYVMHRSFWANLQKSKASTSGEYLASTYNPIISNSAAQGFPTAQAGTLWGYPVYLSDKMPAMVVGTGHESVKCFFFGNLRHVYLGARQDLTMTISEHATVGSDNLFEQNMSAVRLTKRHAIAVGLPAAFAIIKTAAS